MQAGLCRLGSRTLNRLACRSVPGSAHRTRFLPSLLIRAFRMEPPTCMANSSWASFLMPASRRIAGIDRSRTKGSRKRPSRPEHGTREVRVNGMESMSSDFSGGHRPDRTFGQWGEPGPGTAVANGMPTADGSCSLPRSNGPGARDAVARAASSAITVERREGSPRFNGRRCNHRFWQAIRAS